MMGTYEPVPEWFVVMMKLFKERVEQKNGDGWLEDPDWENDMKILRGNPSAREQAIILNRYLRPASITPRPEGEE